MDSSATNPFGAKSETTPFTYLPPLNTPPPPPGRNTQPAPSFDPNAPGAQPSGASKPNPFASAVFPKPPAFPSAVGQQAFPNTASVLDSGRPPIKLGGFEATAEEMATKPKFPSAPSVLGNFTPSATTFPPIEPIKFQRKEGSMPPGNQAVSPFAGLPQPPPASTPSILAGQKSLPDTLSQSKPQTKEPPKITFTPPTDQASSTTKTQNAETKTKAQATPAPLGLDQNNKAPLQQPPPKKNAPKLTEPVIPPKENPKGPTRDLMQDFSKWFVLGDKGLMEEFTVYFVEDSLKELYDTFVEEQLQKARETEEKKNLEAAQKFRIYSLSLRFFYKWKENARKKRLRTMRRQQKEDMRLYYENQRAEQKRAKEEAAKKARDDAAKAVLKNTPEEILALIRSQNTTREEAEEALLATGVLAGVSDERQAAKKIVAREFGEFGSPTPSRLSSRPPSRREIPRSRQSSQTRSISGRSIGGRSVSGSHRKSTSKTTALLEEFGPKPLPSFRRSLPPMADDNSKPKGTVLTERWRLKAMGIVQMPDGTAMPESLAEEVRSGRTVIPGSGRQFQSPRRASVSGGTRLDDSRSMPPPPAPNGSMSPNKRKRSSEDYSGLSQDDSSEGGTNSHKRVMSEAEKILQELKTLREDMEDGTDWLRSQNLRMQSEASSRGPTPTQWDMKT